MSQGLRVPGNIDATGTVTAPTFVGALTGAASALATAAKYTSPAQTITAAGSLTLAHGLSAVPTLIQCRLKCTSAELSYSVNDEVLISGFQQSDLLSVSKGVSIVPDATNLNIRFGSTAAVFTLLDKTSGTGGSIDPTKWQLIVRAWVL